jgi:hypothetical protein
MNSYFTIRLRLMLSKSSVYRGSSLNSTFDAANCGKEASVTDLVSATWLP